MDLELTEFQRAVIVSALRWYLVLVRRDYENAVEIGDPIASNLRQRRDTILDLIKTLDPEGPKP